MKATLLCAFLVMHALQVLAVDNCAETGYRNATTTPELTQGPYHLDEAFFRTNVTENQDGIKLHLFLSVRDTNCVPIADAIVEIWHANASGYYSGIAGQNPGGSSATAGEENLNTTFLRGMVQTDENGIADFYTIFPGSYTGRAVHIHHGVHIVTNDTGTDAEDLEDSYLTHIGQLFFEDELVDALVLLAPYAERGSNDLVHLAEDNIFSATGDENLIANVTYTIPDQLDAGATATLEIVVNPMTVEEFRENGSGSMGAGGDIGLGPVAGGAVQGGPMQPPDLTAAISVAG